MSSYHQSTLINNYIIVNRSITLTLGNRRIAQQQQCTQVAMGSDARAQKG